MARESNNGGQIRLDGSVEETIYHRSIAVPVARRDCPTASCAWIAQLAQRLGALHSNIDGLNAWLAGTTPAEIENDARSLLSPVEIRTAQPDVQLEIVASVQAVARAVDELTQQVERIEDAQCRFIESQSQVAQRLDTLSEVAASVLDVVRRRSIIDDEVRGYRNEKHKSELFPIFRAVIGVLHRIAREHPRVEEMRKHVRSGDPIVAEEVLKWVHTARVLDQVELWNLLAQYGIEKYRSKAGDHFDVARHEPIKRVRAHTDDQAGRIAQSYLEGYIRLEDKKVIVREQVRVFVRDQGRS